MHAKIENIYIYIYRLDDHLDDMLGSGCYCSSSYLPTVLAADPPAAPPLSSF
uniref:Uncharacterized protein n=1 Tax=Arundo donax TaxID=35708 RepID=A0A0A9EP20_ARUDO